jgi:hypothetical protein
MTALSNVDLDRLKHCASLGGKARAAKLTPEERRQSSSKAGKALFARMNPEQVREITSKASRTYWARMTPQERSARTRALVLMRSPEVRRNSARKASQRRWGQLAYAANQNDADRVYAFLQEYISAKRFAPTLGEVSRATGHPNNRTTRVLEILDRIGWIQRHPWARGITLTSAASDTTAPASFEASSHPFLVAAAASLMVDRAVDWKRIAKVFKGVVVSRLTASQIARYWRKRCVEAGREMAEREANILLGLRFPEMFLERHQVLSQLSDFVDLPRSKRGCQSCRAKFVKIRPNQRYCSARCRRREKRRRREATLHGRLRKSQQNKRYRYKYAAREHERKRQWRLTHPQRYQAQRSREATRRTLSTNWNRQRYPKTPPALTHLLIAQRDGPVSAKTDAEDIQRRAPAHGNGAALDALVCK